VPSNFVRDMQLTARLLATNRHNVHDDREPGSPIYHWTLQAQVYPCDFGPDWGAGPCYLKADC